MTSVVTGASGHLGANLVRWLKGQGHQVRALVHRESHALDGVDVEVHRADILDVGSLRRAFSGARHVYHLAGKISTYGDPDGSVLSTNVQGTENVVQACLSCGIERLVHCSSVQAFDFHRTRQELLDETVPLVPLDSKRPWYDRSKAESERRVQAGIKRGLDAVIVNPTGVAGPNDFGPSRLGQVFLDLRDRKLPSLTQGGFDFVDVRDVAQGMTLALERGRTGENYLLGNRSVSLQELARLAQKVTGSAPPAFTAPLWLAKCTAPLVELEARLRHKEPLYSGESLGALSLNRPVCHDKATRELGYSTRPLEETVADVYASFESRGV